MYIPKPFAVHDRAKLHRFIKENSFAILISQGKNGIDATHVPLLLKEDEGEHGTLYGHMAIGNPQWREIRGEVLAVFPGPHSYISPTWYEEEKTVPTWNYVAVHVYGQFNLIEDQEELKRLLSESIDFYESHLPDPWHTDLNEEHNQLEMKGIKGFKIAIREIQGKWKLNQHHPTQRQRNTIKHLKRENRYNGSTIAEYMEENLKKQDDKK